LDFEIREISLLSFEIWKNRKQISKSGTF